MPDESFEAVTITLPDESQVLVRTWGDGHVDVDIRAARRFGSRSWTPLGIHGGSFSVEHCDNRSYS